MLRGMTAAVAVWLLVMGLAAQAQEIFKGRLAPVPVDAQTKASITGAGTVSAILTGTRLSVTGSFEGLKTPATLARVHLGPAPGVHGAPIFDLTVTKATSGAVSGTLELTPEQVERLRKGGFYVQIASEKAPDGNLWGWLLK
jgi:CHRD domain-containing protein